MCVRAKPKKKKKKIQSFWDHQPVDGMLYSPRKTEGMLTRAMFENFLNEGPGKTRLC